MSIITLPADLLSRAANREDAQAIAEINAGYELAMSGTIESTSSDVRELWDDNQMDLASDTCVVTTAQGKLVGYIGVAGNRRGVMLDVHTTVHPDYRQLPLFASLFQFADQRTCALLEADTTRPRRAYTYSFTPAQTTLLQQQGYQVDTSDYRMGIILEEAPPAPQPLSGVTIRTFISGQEERAVHAVIAEAFPDIDGKPYRSYEEWYPGIFESRTSFDPSMLYVALVDNQIVGTVLSRVYPEVHEGYIWQLGMCRAWRKRGIAQQLLRTAFAEFYRRGITRIMLDVDSNNPTGAHQLYASVGLHKRSQVDCMYKLFA